MAESITPRMLVHSWTSGTDTPSRTDFENSFQNIERYAVKFAQGTLAARPAAGTANAGMLYFVDDGANVGRFFWCDGIDWTPVNVSIHAALSGLANDDHQQYYNQERGDARYVRLAGSNMQRGALTQPQLVAYSEKVVENTAATGAVTVSLLDANIHRLTLTGAVALTMAGAPPSGQSGTVTLVLQQDITGSRTVTWPTGTRWAYGVVPTLSTGPGAVDIITLTTIDGGTNWYGFVSGIGMA